MLIFRCYSLLMIFLSLLVAAGTLLLPGCGDNTPLQLREDEILKRERAAIAALQRHGCKVEDTQDEIIGTTGILVKMAPEHFDEKGVMLRELSRELRELRNCFLVLDRTTVSSAGLGELRAFDNLLLLSVQGVKLTDEELQQIEGIVSLRLLRLNNTGIDDRSLRHIIRLPKLAMLYVSQNRLSDQSLEYIRDLKQLRALQIADCAVSDIGVNFLIDLQQLEYLSLRGTDITDESLSVFKRLPKLRFVDVAETKVTREAISEIQEAMPNCYVSQEVRPRIGQPLELLK